MKLKKLFQVLVLGGASLGALAQCGPGNSGDNDPPPTPPSDGGSSDNTDGGRLPDGGIQIGPHFW
jgi:hypothetical protein